MKTGNYSDGNQMAESAMIQSISNLVLDNLDALVIVCDAESYKVLYMNEPANQIYGNGIGKTCYEWFHPGKFKPCFHCSIDKLLNDESCNNMAVNDFYNTLTDKWYEVHDKLIEWPNGHKAKLRIAFNIDHRKQDEKKLLVLYKQQELFSRISTSFNSQETFAHKVNEVLTLVGHFVDLSRVSIFEKEAGKRFSNLTYEWCQDNIEQKINHLRELKFNVDDPMFELIEKNELIIINDLNSIQYRDLFAAFVNFSVRSMLFLPLMLHDEQVGYLSFEVCNQLRIWQKDEIQLIKTFGNIIATSFERRGIEEKRLRTERRLKQANATKDKFFSIVTRDLLAPFSALTSLSSMLLENYTKWNDEKRLLFVDSIRDSSKQGFKLLDNLITWSKIQSGKIEFFPKEVDIRSAISLAVEQLTEKAKKKNIAIEGVPADFTFVYADYLMLHTIMKNLLSNAIKFTPEYGTVMINLKKDDNFVEISVLDNGIGIEKAFLGTLFNIDRLSSDFGPTEDKGTGLGLIICKEFVEKNGGKIWAESKLGQGSCFTFTVPLSK